MSHRRPIAFVNKFDSMRCVSRPPFPVMLASGGARDLHRSFGVVRAWGSEVGGRRSGVTEFRTQTKFIRKFSGNCVCAPEIEMLYATHSTHLNQMGENNVRNLKRNNISISLASLCYLENCNSNGKLMFKCKCAAHIE